MIHNSFAARCGYLQRLVINSVYEYPYMDQKTKDSPRRWASNRLKMTECMYHPRVSAKAHLPCRNANPRDHSEITQWLLPSTGGFRNSNKVWYSQFLQNKRKSRFQCCTGHFWSNQLVIVVKRIRNISFKIVETFVLIPSIDASNRRI